MSYQLAILLALNGKTRFGGHMYTGTVPDAERLRRRARNKRARAARRATR